MRAALLLLALSGCASFHEQAQDGSRFIVRKSLDGAIKPVLLVVGQRCPQAVVSAPNGGCYFNGPVIFLTNPSDHAGLQHEIDHDDGLAHGPWENKCARIIRAGRTHWTAGKLLCRHPQWNHFYEVDQ